MSDEEAAPLIRKLERLGYTVLAPAKAGWSVVSTDDVVEDPPLAISTPLPRHVPWPQWGYE